MNELNLSADARRRLWQCYSLLLRLADQVEKNTAADSPALQSTESAAATKANELTQPGNDTSEAGPRQMEAEEQVERKT